MMTSSEREFRIIRAEEREYRDRGWLKTHYLFSFDDYYDAENEGFGVLRVFNDDSVEPGKGFPDHHHGEMEIVTYVLSGEVTHRDSTGNRATTKANGIQRMSAGTGVVHSEFNMGSEPLHLYQIWFLPNRGGLHPSYEQRSFPPDRWRNKILPVVSGEGLKDVVRMSADATVYLASLGQGKELHFEPSHYVFIYITEGAVEVNGRKLGQWDQARVTKGRTLVFTAAVDSSFVIIDMPAKKTGGRA